MLESNLSRPHGFQLGHAHQEHKLARILIIDDNRDAADMLAALLSMHGHQLRQAYHGAQGLALLQELAADIVLLDLCMPGLSGYEVASKLRHGAAKCPYLVAYTAWNDAETLQRCQQAGFDSHLTKTAPLDQVLSSLEQALA
jgi:CheY-like chemotaxis protein